MAIPTASDNPFPSILAVETASASITSPAAGKQRLFVDTDHVLKYKNSAGVVSNVGAAAAGTSSLVYRYTVTGADKSTIDTGVDVADAGSGVWTGDLLEIYVYSRTDEATVASQINFFLNNDTSSVYDVERLLVQDTGVTGANSLARSGFFQDSFGSSAAASTFASTILTFPNHAGTVGFKSGQQTHGLPSQAAGSTESAIWALGYRSTTAITRFSMAVNTGAKKFKIGTQLLIYAR